MLKLRKSNERGQADHGWLRSFHPFSFATYYDPNHMHFGPLRVINEDFVAPGTGFPTPPHSDMEIITYVIEGALAHKDSMGNGTAILPGEVQRMSAGTGVRHSEFNHSKDSWTHLLQIWILPRTPGGPPSYEQKSFAKKLAQEEWVLVASNDGREGSVSMGQDALLYVGKWENAHTHQINLRPERKYWLQMVKGESKVNGTSLSSGDALAIDQETLLLIESSGPCELLFFDLP